MQGVPSDQRTSMLIRPLKVSGTAPLKLMASNREGLAGVLDFMFMAGIVGSVFTAGTSPSVGLGLQTERHQGLIHGVSQRIAR